jgi:hypothetical protein
LFDVLIFDLDLLDGFPGALLFLLFAIEQVDKFLSCLLRFDVGCFGDCIAELSFDLAALEDNHQ